MARTSSRDAARRGNSAAESQRVGKSLFPDIGSEAADAAGRDATRPEAELPGGERPGADPAGVGPDAVALATAPPPSFDDVRAGWTGIGLALYAFEPGGEVTLEIHSEGQVYTFNAPTAEAAFAIAFPPGNRPAPLGAVADVFG